MAFRCQKSNTVVGAFTGVVCLEQRQEPLSKLLLGIDDGFEITVDRNSKDWIAFKLDALANHTALRRSHELDLGVFSVASTHDHAFRHQICELSWLQINEHDNQTFSHTGQWHVLLEA